MSEEWSALAGETSRKRTTSELSSAAETEPAKRARSSRSPSSEADSASQARDESPRRAAPTQGPSHSSPEDSSQDGKRKSEERRLMALISHFSSDHLNRFEMYRRAALPKAGVRRLMQSAVDTSIPQNAVIAMCGIAKVFVGEIIEEALDYKERMEEEGPLQPKHIREALRRLRVSGSVPNRAFKKRTL